MSQGDLLIVVGIACPSAREHFRLLFDALMAESTFLEPHRFASRSLEVCESLNLAADALKRHYSSAAKPLAIVISDELVDSRSPRSRAPAASGLSERAKESLDPDLLSPHGTIAITDDGERLVNIDRVLPRKGTTAAELRRSVELVAYRLIYMLPPVVHRESEADYCVRRIRDETELKAYYRLRHHVYEVMGYMNYHKERVKSRMEIDGCDATSLHLGAFAAEDALAPSHFGRAERIAGTARLVFMNGDQSASIINGLQWTEHLLRTDRRLRAIVCTEQLPIGLPVFHSQDLNDHLHEAIEGNINCAELSRVIVHPEHRGGGLSSRLVAKSIEEAREARVDRLYLECLDVHEGLYQKRGFRTIPSARGIVVGVGRTMIAMVADLQHADSVKPHRPR